MTTMTQPKSPSAAPHAPAAAAPTNVGLLVIGRKRAGFDQDWNAMMRQRTASAFSSLNFHAVGADTPVVDDQTILAALDQVRSAGCQAIVVLQPSLGNGQLAMTVEQHWPHPIVLLATPERPTGEKVSSCSLVANHLWASVLRQANHPFELVYGDPDSPDTRQQLARAVSIATAARAARTAKIGLIGSHAPGFIAMGADPLTLSRALRGTQLHNLSLTQFIDRCNAIDDKSVARDVDQVRSIGLPMKGASAADLPANSRYYLAIRQLMHEEALDAIAVQCWPELSNSVGHWPYLAFTRLTSEGIPVAMEGDVDAAIQSLMANHLRLGVGFITDWLEHDHNTVGFWHAGVAPLPLCYPIGSPDGPFMAHHFNIDRPMVVDGPLRTGMDVTVTRLWRTDGQYHLTAFEGRTIEPRRRLTGNTAWVDAGALDLTRWFDDRCHDGMPHHVTLFQGHSADTWRRLARCMGIRWQTSCR